MTRYTCIVEELKVGGLVAGVYLLAYDSISRRAYLAYCTGTTRGRKGPVHIRVGCSFAVEISSRSTNTHTHINFYTQQ